MSLLNVRHFSSSHLWQRTMFNLSYNWNFLRARVKIASEKLINKNYLSIHSDDLDSPKAPPRIEIIIYRRLFSAHVCALVEISPCCHLIMCYLFRWQLFFSPFLLVRFLQQTITQHQLHRLMKQSLYGNKEIIYFIFSHVTSSSCSVPRADNDTRAFEWKRSNQ